MPSRTILITGFLGIWPVAAAFAAPPSAPPGWTDGYVTANGIRIHYWRTGGNKPVLVLAHGYSDDGLCWEGLARELQSNFDIIMVDARGHGLSDPPGSAEKPEAMVEDLAGLIKELKLTKPIIMGHSMGSSTVAWLAAMYPDMPRAIILEDPGLTLRPPSRAPGDVEKRRAEVIARNNMTQDELVAQCRQNTPKWEPADCEFWAASKRRYHPSTAMPVNGTRPAVTELLPAITVPTLILKADAQGEVRTQNEKAAQLLKNGKLVHIEGAGHNVRRDEKLRTLAVLKPFLAGL